MSDDKRLTLAEARAQAAKKPPKRPPAIPAVPKRPYPDVAATLAALPPMRDYDMERRILLEGWTPADLGAIYDGGYEHPRPELLAPAGEPGLFYRRAVNCLYGDSGSGKSWVALRAARDEMDAGGHVLWIDLEANGPEVVERLRTIAVSRETITGRFHYVQPVNSVGRQVVDHITGLVESLGITMVVLDSIGEAFSVEGLNEDRDNEVGPWIRQVLRPIADNGVMVVVIDHSTKAKDAPLYPSGSKRKRAAWTGAGYLVEARPAFTRDSIGWLSLTTAKDRHGTRQAGTEAARVQVSPELDGGLSFSVHPASKPAVGRDQTLDDLVVSMVSVLKDLGGDTGVSQRVVLERASEAGVKGKTDAKRAALEEAVRLGYVSADQGPRNAHMYRFASDVPDGEEDPT